MSDRITPTMVDARFARLRELAPSLPWTHVTIGSRYYGNSFNVYTRDPDNGGHSNVRHIGWTNREAYDWLGAAIATACELDRAAREAKA